MNWFIFSVLSAFSFTAYSILIRLVLKDHGDAKAFAPVSNLFVSIILLAIALFSDSYFHFSYFHVFLLIVGSVSIAIASLLITQGRQLSPASSVSLIRQISSIWIFVGGIILLDESFSWFKLGGFTLIILGNIIAFFRTKHIFDFTKGEKFVFAATFLIAVNSLVSSHMVQNAASPALYSGMMVFLAFVWVTIFLPKSLTRELGELRLHSYKLPLISTLLALSVFFIVSAYEVGEASRIVPVRSSSLVMVVLIGTFFLGERERYVRKIIGAFFVFAGVVLLQSLS